MKKPKVYLETSFISHICARSSKDVTTLSHQKLSKIWWENFSGDFQMYVSQLVHDEAARGDQAAASRRLKMLCDFPVLDLNEKVRQLVNELMREKIVPKESVEDAFHISFAAVHNMDYLLTWNCKHIANATKRQAIVNICEKTGFRCPVICTPEELIDEEI
ncbi:MAG: type II toxin-antitoxin system VapC family toxin [Planctomycetes bacterium]|nr:type II toxin-antitoxin system VapC family toxin [Planctomycetota bacterium]